MDTIERYFAFGSNMSKEQMAKRTPSAVQQGIAFLPDYELVFNRLGSFRPGGVASVVPKKGSRVYGVIYSLSASDLRVLDAIENPNAYRRISREVTTPNGARVLCYLYEAFPEGTFSPGREYIELIVKAATEVGLPEPYLKHLRSLVPVR